MVVEHNEKELAVVNSCYLLSFSTISKHGYPVTLPMWYVFTDPSFYITTKPSATRLENINRDNRTGWFIHSHDGSRIDKEPRWVTYEGTVTDILERGEKFKRISGMFHQRFNQSNDYYNINNHPIVEGKYVILEITPTWKRSSSSLEM